MNMNKPLPKVLLTNSIHEAQQQRLEEYAEVVVAPDTSPDTLRHLIADANALIVRHKLPDDIFNHAPRLRGVVRHGVGLDMIPMQEANAKHIPVANIPGSNTASVVEYCINAMFMMNRNLAMLTLKNTGDWSQIRQRGDAMLELHGQTLGIVGVGAIGSALARVAQALGMSVNGLTRSPNKLPNQVTASTKEDLFKASDFIVLACPLTDETRGLVDAPTLALMKSNSVLINVSRGPVVDTAALVDALERGAIGGAVLDVHDVQPIPNGLYSDDAMKRMILTPHVAGTTRSSMERMSRGSVDEVLRLLEGKQFVNFVNPEIYE